MRRFIIPIILLIAAGGIFFAYIDPTYQDIQQLRSQQSQLDEALDRARELQQARDQLLSQYNTFNQDQLARLHELLPGTVDNVRLALDLDQLASQHDMQIQDISIEDSESGDGSSDAEIGPDTRPYGSARLSFSMFGSYGSFMNFLRSLENSLRLVDVEEIEFEEERVNEERTITSERQIPYTYEVTIRTYWLKSDI